MLGLVNMYNTILQEILANVKFGNFAQNNMIGQISNETHIILYMYVLQGENVSMI